MALPSLVTVDDLATWMGVEFTDEDRAEAILSAASTLVRTYAGRMWVDAAGEPEEDLTETQLDAVYTVVKLVAERVWNNPRGITQESTGPFSRSVAAWAALGLVLTADEKTMLGGGAGGIPGLSSIRVVAPAAASASRLLGTWLDDDDPDNQFEEEAEG